MSNLTWSSPPPHTRQNVQLVRRAQDSRPKLQNRILLLHWFHRQHLPREEVSMDRRNRCSDRMVPHERCETAKRSSQRRVHRNIEQKVVLLWVMTVDGNYGGIANSSIANNTDYQLRGVAHASALTSETHVLTCGCLYLRPRQLWREWRVSMDRYCTIEYFDAFAPAIDHILCVPLMQQLPTLPTNIDTSGPKKPSPTLETSSKSRTASCLPETRSPQALPASSECPTTRALVTLTWARRWVTGSVCLPRVPPNPSPIPSLTTTNKRINRFPSSCPNPTDPFGHFCT